MNHREAGQIGGLATLAKHGLSHYRNIGLLGGRPPITIIAPNGTPRGEKINRKGGQSSAGDHQTLLKRWESHPLNKFAGGFYFDKD